MTTTKIVGGICGSLLVLLLVKWGGEIIFHGSGHGDVEAAYVIEVEDSGATEAAANEGPVFADLYAAADIAKGEKLFGKCKSCHKLEDGANGTGPHLYGLVDRVQASIDGYGYSGALSGLSGSWTIEELDAFLKRPKDYAPGTSMGFAGLKKPEDRANLIAYLATIGG